MAAMKTWKRVWHGWVALSLALFIAPPTNAQDVDPQAAAMAQSLYEQAVGLMDAKNFAVACPKLEQVTKLVPTGLGGRLALGECYVGLGRLASAWAQYVKAAALATAAGEPDTAAEARAEAGKLKPRLAMVTITVQDAMRGLPGLSVTWDGLVQDEAVWGTPMPVDAIKHVIEVKAPTRQTWTREVVVVTDGVSLEEKVPILRVAPVEMKTSRAPATPSRTWMRPVGIAALGVGAAGLVVGGVLGGVALSKRDASNAEGECNAQNFCNARGVTMREEMLVFAHGSTTGWIAGGVFAASGAILLIAAPRQKKDDVKRGSVAWQLGLVPGGMSVEGVW